MTIEDQAGTIRTREDLVAFIHAFYAEYRANGVTWENADLGAFLEAMAGWAHDMDGYYANLNEDLGSLPPWRVFADLLMAARMYE
jgi:hypothetical protein